MPISTMIMLVYGIIVAETGMIVLLQDADVKVNAEYEEEYC